MILRTIAGHLALSNKEAVEPRYRVKTTGGVYLMDGPDGEPSTFTGHKAAEDAARRFFGTDWATKAMLEEVMAHA